MHRTQTKNITEEAVLLRRCRESRGLSMSEAANLTGKSISWISHIENGRMDVTSEHYRLLLPLYGQTEQTFYAYLTGKAFLYSPSRKECLDTIQTLPDRHIDALLPLVQTLKTSKPVKEDK